MMMLMMVVFDTALKHHNKTNEPFESFLLPLCQNILVYFQANRKLIFI